MESSFKKIIKKVEHWFKKYAKKNIKQVFYFTEKIRRRIFWIGPSPEKLADNRMDKRYDYFLIWGHGLKYKKEIIDMIRENNFLEIKKIMFYKVKNMSKFIKKTIYGYDYAPFWHLKAKTRYLLNVDPNVCIIFVLNKNPKELFSGKDFFRHIECMKIKRIKNKIRDKFNPRKNDLRTENHVIHASDNEFQADHLIKFLGFIEGIQCFERKPNPILSSPYYIPSFNSFKVKKIKLSQLYGRVLKGDVNKFTTELCSLEESPHYKYLTGDKKVYQKYLEIFGGYLLTDDYSAEKFDKLFQNSFYLKYPHNTSYILVEEVCPDKYVILDGVHRASKLLFLRQKEAIVAVKQPIKRPKNILFRIKGTLNYLRN